MKSKFGHSEKIIIFNASCIVVALSLRYYVIYLYLFTGCLCECLALTRFAYFSCTDTKLNFEIGVVYV